MSIKENKETSLSLLGSIVRYWCHEQLPEFRQQLEELGQGHLDEQQQARVERLGQMTRCFQQVLRLGLPLGPGSDEGPMDLEVECRKRQLGLQKLAESRGLILRIQFDGLIAQRFEGRVDEALVILELLVERALHLVEKGGVDIAVRGIDSAMGYRVEFRIMDTGPGMGLEDQNHLWDLEASQKDPDRLTLNLIKRRTEEVGGGMGVDSKEGVGSCFWFEWPMLPVDTDDSGVATGSSTRQQIFIRGGGAHQFRSLSIRLENMGFLPERLPEDPSSLLVGGGALEDILPPMLVVALLKESGTPEDEVLEEMMEAYPSMRVMVIVDKGVRGDSNHFQILGACSYLVQSLPPEIMKKMLKKMLEWEHGDPLITRSDIS